MKYLSIALAYTAIFTSSQAAIIEHVDDVDTEKGYLKFDFEKLHGSSLDTATKERKFSELMVKRDDDMVEMILSNRNTFYTANLSVGTPGQEVAVLVDTGSSDLWIMGNSNPYCISRSNVGAAISSTASGRASGTASTSSPRATLNCARYGTFDMSQSSTFNNNGTSFYNSYGDTSMASGPWGTDSISFGNITLDNISFGVANVSNASQGILGIGMKVGESTYSGVGLLTSGATPYMYENLPAALVNQGFIKTNAYSLFLNSQDASTGSVLFGAVDHSKYSGQLYTLPILKMYQLKSSTQSIALSFDITVQGVGLTDGSTYKTVTTTPFPALLDSGTTLMYLPYLLSDLIAAQVGASYSSSVGYYLMDCLSDDDPTQIVFDFGGFQISNNLTNYMLQTSASSSICILGIVPTTTVYGIFGDVFLVDAYVVYDLDNLEISMAQANFDSSEPEVEIISDTVPSATAGSAYSSTWSTVRSITSGGNIFTLSTTGSTSRASTTGGALSRASQTTASTVGSNGASRLASSTATVSTSTSSAKKNIGEKSSTTSLFFIISTFICSIFL